jgi:F0F1-type ATP synthase assembly protein I
MHSPPRPDAPDEGGGDPWAAFGYLVAGVLFYGFLGWLLSIWLHAEYWIPIGILVGAGFGMYMVFARYRLKAPETQRGTAGSIPSQNRTMSDDEAARTTRPDSDDRGETA